MCILPLPGVLKIVLTNCEDISKFLLNLKDLVVKTQLCIVEGQRNNWAKGSNVLWFFSVPSSSVFGSMCDMTNCAGTNTANIKSEISTKHCKVSQSTPCPSHSFDWSRSLWAEAEQIGNAI